MNKITSFTINHLKLLPGVYVSRKDKVGDNVLTTFDLRITRPNYEPVMNTAEIHTIEHLGATYLRNNFEWGNKTIYFGPMGCLTGFYLIVKELDLNQVIELVKEVFSKIALWDQEIPGAKIEECGNYSFMDLNKAKEAARYFINSSWQHQYHYLK